MVRCSVLKKMEDPINKEFRYVPHNEFHLWKFYMENHHKFSIYEEKVSIWIDEEEYNKYLQIYNRLELEEVREIKIVRFAYDTQLTIPIIRYIAEKNSENIKNVILAHYSDEEKDAIRNVKERKGFWIERKGFWIKR